MSPQSKKTVAYILMIAGILFSAFFRSLKGTLVSHPMLWYMLGIAISLSGFFLYLNSRKKKSNGQNMFSSLQTSALMQSGERVNVLFENCKVVSTQSIKANAEHDGMAVLLAGKALDTFDRAMDDGPPVGSTLHESVFIFEYEWKGSRRKFISPIIPKDSVTLEFLLAGQKSTTLYIDPDDPEKYHFDLLFLYN